jgi:hypothetical protein
MPRRYLIYGKFQVHSLTLAVRRRRLLTVRLWNGTRRMCQEMYNLSCSRRFHLESFKEEVKG